MKVFILLSALLAFSAASSILPDKFEVNPNIDTTEVIQRFASIVSHKLSRPLHNAISSRNAVNDMIIALLESLRDQFETGFPDAGVPPLDPFEIDELQFDVSESFILKVQIILRDIMVTGLKEFIISKIDFKILRLTLDYEFIVPQIDFSSQFEVDGKVASIINVNPKGAARIGLTDFATSGSIKLGVNSTGYLRLNGFEMDYDAKDFSVYLEGLFEIDKINELLNFVLQYLSNDFFQGQRERLNAWATDVISEVLAEVLSEIKLSDILG